MDPLSEILKSVRLSGAIFINAEASSPWCILSPPSKRIGPLLSGRDDHVIIYHLATAGRGYVSAQGETVEFAAGDLIVFPHGDEHLMGNGVGAEPVSSEKNLPMILARGLEPLRFGGSGEETRLICGYFCCDPRLTQPLLSGLPRILKLSLRDEPSGAWLETSIHHAVMLVAGASPGSDMLVARLSEVLFAETLRRYMATLSGPRTGWLAASRDPIVSKSLAALHARPESDWSLERLAKEVGSSRSALTERFARYLDTSPMAYLADWRLELAADALRSSSRSVLQIAGSVGYESEAAFNRAFKRRFDVPPARYRRNAQRERSLRAKAVDVPPGGRYLTASRVPASAP
jgi:AraC-like DNA-binding protein